MGRKWEEEMHVRGGSKLFLVWLRSKAGSKLPVKQAT